MGLSGECKNFEFPMHSNHARSLPFYIHLKQTANDFNIFQRSNAFEKFNRVIDLTNVKCFNQFYRANNFAFRNLLIEQFNTTSIHVEASHHDFDAEGQINKIVLFVKITPGNSLDDVIENFSQTLDFNNRLESASNNTNHTTFTVQQLKFFPATTPLQNKFNSVIDAFEPILDGPTL
jgi:hypothetical protein